MKGLAYESKVIAIFDFDISFVFEVFIFF
jgi:hypothetical protein